jgi:hypothetical protein
MLKCGERSVEVERARRAVLPIPGPKETLVPGHGHDVVQWLRMSRARARRRRQSRAHTLRHSHGPLGETARCARRRERVCVRARVRVHMRPWSRLPVDGGSAAAES